MAAFVILMCISKFSLYHENATTYLIERDCYLLSNYLYEGVSHIRILL
jgi:hypothetical protein